MLGYASYDSASSPAPPCQFGNSRSRTRSYLPVRNLGTTSDTASGAKTERKGLEAALSYVRKDDSLVVWRLDRLGRSLPHLIATMTDLEERGIGFKSLTENIDTTTSGGKLIFHIFGALAEFERNLIRERTQAGLAAARERTQRWKTQSPDR
jgi:DNA invertase Pin-like site-specific DNA recombinase